MAASLMSRRGKLRRERRSDYDRGDGYRLGEAFALKVTGGHAMDFRPFVVQNATFLIVATRGSFWTCHESR